MFVPRLEGPPRDDIDPNTQEFLKILEQADLIKKRGTRLEIHEQVQIALWASLSPGNGTEHGDPMSPARARDAQDLRTTAAQTLQGQYVIGHPSRVSPQALVRGLETSDPSLQGHQAAPAAPVSTSPVASYAHATPRPD